MKKYGEPIFGTVKEQQPVVRTRKGFVQGENRDGIAIFRGIPYGAACDGMHRFLPPESAKPWKGILNCTKNGFYAVQEGTSISGSEELGAYFNGGNPERFGVKEEQQNENCLVLNVLTPGIDIEKRPVVVYIHGGGFSTGSGTLVLGADRLAREEDIVIVGVNHRLNVFGYLYLGNFDERYAQSGVAGMLDLVLALKWVRNNISFFGGDPAKVTIMGESGGAMKVNTLMAMPETQGLFCRAIVESGSMPIGRVSQAEGIKRTKNILQLLGIDEKNWKKLLTISAEELKRAAFLLEKTPLDFVPVADGIHLRYQEEERIVVPEAAKEIPLLIGASEDEVGIFVTEEELNVTWKNLKEKLLEHTDNWFLKTGRITENNVEAVIETFRKTNVKNDTASHLFLKIKSMFGELGYWAYEQAEQKVRQGGAAVYQYLVSYDTPLPARANRRYAWHTAELPLQMRIVLHRESEVLSKLMAHTLAAFIRTGNPSTEQLEWLPFTLERRSVMVFDNESRIETKERLG